VCVATIDLCVALIILIGGKAGKTDMPPRRWEKDDVVLTDETRTVDIKAVPEFGGLFHRLSAMVIHTCPAPARPIGSLRVSTAMLKSPLLSRLSRAKSPTSNLPQGKVVPVFGRAVQMYGIRP
jgi:hypothetical protein